MSQEPDYLARWTNGTDLFKALSHLAGEIGEMAGDDARIDDPRPDLWERILNAARQVDSLVCETRYRTLTPLWTEIDRIFGLLEDLPDRRYARVVADIAGAVETLLLEMTHGRGERNADYWPKKSKEFRRHTLCLDSALEQLERTPVVKEEVLRRARGESQPRTLAEPTATAAGSPGRNAGRTETQDYFLIAEFRPAEEEGVGRLEDLTPEEAAATEKALKMQLQPSDPACFMVNLVSDSEARADPARYLVLCQQVGGYDEKERFSLMDSDPMIPISEASLASENDWFGLRWRAREYAQTARRHREEKARIASRGASSRFEVWDKESCRAVVFDTAGTQIWGPICEYEGGHVFDELPDYAHELTLYRHESGHWTLVTETSHCEAGSLGPPEASRLTDAEAADWLVRHGFDPPADVAALATGSFFTPGSPKPAEDRPPPDPEHSDEETKPRWDNEAATDLKANPRPAFHGDQPALSPIMEAKVQKAMDFIDNKGKVKALSVAKEIGVKEGTFRKYYVPILKQRGVQNDGTGYYRPKEGDKA